MFDDKKFGTIFPTRTGTPSGTTNERIMLDKFGGSDGFRTQYQSNGDGSVTMLRTKNGMPQFSTVGTTTSTTTLWRGLAAFPEGFEPSTTWSTPVVFSATESYKIVFKNPVQLVPRIYVYWVGPNGNVCGNNGQHAYFSRTGKGSKYTKVTVTTLPTTFIGGFSHAPEAKYKAIPFIPASSTQLFFATSNAVTDLFGEAAFCLAPLTVNYPWDKEPTYADQLQQVISPDGNDVVLHAKDEKYFTEFIPSSYTTNEKCYWYLRLTMGSNGWNVSCDETLVKVVAAKYSDDAVGVMTTRVLDHVTDTIEKLAWSYVLPTQQQWVPNYVWYHNHAYAFPAPKLNICEVIGRTDSTLGDEAAIFKSWPLTIKRTDVKVVGFANAPTVLTPVTITMQCNLNRNIEIEGQHYFGSRAESVAHAELWPTEPVKIRAWIGDNTKECTRVLIDLSENNDSFIAVSVGGLYIKTFEILQSSSGDASRKVIQRQTSAGSVDWPWSESDQRLSGDFFIRNWQDVPEPCTSNGCDASTPSPHHGAEFTESGIVLEANYEALAAAQWAKPTPYEYYSFLGDAPTFEDNATDYITNLNLSAKSRFIVAFDAAIPFYAYVEMEVSYNVTAVATKEQNWVFDSRPLNVPQRKDPHNVKCTFVINYQGTEHRKELFSVVVEKPLDLAGNKQINWYSWEPNKLDDGEMEIISSAIYIPTPTTFKGIDGVFMHQGLCPDFAGYTSKEIEYPLSAGYAADSDIKRLIYAKRFKLTDDKMHWLLNYLKIDECKRGAGLNSPPEDLAAYYYSPELKEKIEATYQVEFDQTGFVDWVDNIPKAPVSPPDRDASCWRI